MFWKNLNLVPKVTDDVMSSIPYFALIFWILNEFKRDKNVQREFKGQIKTLLKIADDNSEEKDYLVNKIQEMTGEKLDDCLLNLFELAK